MKFRSILAAVIAAVLVALVPATSFAKPGDDINARKFTGSFVVGNAQLLEYGCFYHPYTVNLAASPGYPNWDADIRITAPNGSLADINYMYGTGSGAGTFNEEFFLCSSLDQPGTYTISGTVTVDSGYPYYNEITTPMTSATFQVLPYVAPVVATPPPAPAPVPAPVADVAGKVTKKFIERGVQFTFKSKATPTGSTVGTKLQWSIVSGDKVKSFQQGPSATSKKTLKFPKGSGVHKIKVLRNGKVAMRLQVKA